MAQQSLQKTTVSPLDDVPDYLKDVDPTIPGNSLRLATTDGIREVRLTREIMLAAMPAIALTAVNMAMNGDINMIRLILAYGLGKPVQMQQIEVNSRNAHVVVHRNDPIAEQDIQAAEQFYLERLVARQRAAVGGEDRNINLPSDTGQNPAGTLSVSGQILDGQVAKTHPAQGTPNRNEPGNSH